MRIRKTKKWRLLIEVFIDSTLIMVALYLLSYSVQQYLTIWFTSNFADTNSLLVSLGLVLVSVALPLSSFWVKKRLTRSSIKKSFPAGIRKEDYPDWKKEAKLIKFRRNDLLYATLISTPPIYLGYVFVLFSQWLLGYLASHQYLNFVLTLNPNAQVFVILGLFAVIAITLAIVPMLIVSMGTLHLLRKFLNYPKDEDFIFAECILIAECLSRNDRSGAHREVHSFLVSLTQFSRNWFNNRRKVYSQEVAILRKNKTALCRMVRFTEDYASSQIGELFVNLGLSLVRGDDPNSFRNMNFLIENSKRYEPMGRWQRIMTRIERYPTTVNLMNIIIYVAVLILALIAFALGYPAISSLLRG